MYCLCFLLRPAVFWFFILKDFLAHQKDSGYLEFFGNNLIINFIIHGLPLWASSPWWYCFGKQVSIFHWEQRWPCLSQKGCSREYSKIPQHFWLYMNVKWKTYMYITFWNFYTKHTYQNAINFVYCLTSGRRRNNLRYSWSDAIFHLQIQ